MFIPFAFYARRPAISGILHLFTRTLIPIIFCFSYDSFILAQAPVWRLATSNFEVGDTITWEVEWGNAAQPIEDAYELTTSHYWNGWKISTDIGGIPNYEGSWLFDITGNNASIEIGEDGKSIDLHIIRNDSVGHDGWGLALQVRGVVTEIEDVIFRTSQSNEREVKVFPNPAREYLFIEPVFPSKHIQKVLIYNNWGRKAMEWSGSSKKLKWAISGLSEGIYYVYVFCSEVPTFHKIRIL